MESSYDVVPYESYPYSQSHPVRLLTIASLFGVQPPRVSTCRVLELGCSSGGNLLPMAEQFPQTHLLGIDGSRRQIEDGQRVVRELGLTNVELRHQDIREFSAGPESFDYIIVHGVFSWVPNEVQDRILEICSRCLAPQGVAYVSYNTYPGWRLRGMIRDLMTYRAAFFQDPAVKVREARALLDFLAESVPTENNAYGLLLSDEVRWLRSRADSYLLHEHLEEVNEPLYFHQFMARAAAKGLQYLGEADFSTMSAANFPPQVESMVCRLSATTPAEVDRDAPPRRARGDDLDVIQLEQYMDFVRNRLFRQTLLCRADVTLDRRLPPERVYGMYIASSGQPEVENLDPCTADRVTFRRPGSTLTTNEPLVKAAMLHLRSIWPRSMAFADLLAAARRRLYPGALVLDARRAEEEKRTLAAPLLRCYATTHVDLSAEPERFTLEPPERPQATRLARFQAQAGQPVTNLAHESVRLSDLERHVLRFLDGGHDRPLLLEVLADEVRAGRLVVHEQGEEIDDPERVQTILRQILDETLLAIIRKGLVMV
jgi:methyltransferase-like protein/SAM-dependent methyltransferase